MDVIGECESIDLKLIELIEPYEYLYNASAGNINFIAQRVRAWDNIMFEMNNTFGTTLSKQNEFNKCYLLYFIVH